MINEGGGEGGNLEEVSMISPPVEVLSSMDNKFLMAG